MPSKNRLTIMPVKDNKLGYHTNILRIQSPDSIIHNRESIYTLYAEWIAH